MARFEEKITKNQIISKYIRIPVYIISTVIYTSNEYITYTTPDLLGFLLTQLPVLEIFQFAKKNRDPNWREIELEIGKVANENKEEVVDLLSNSMIKAMEEDVRLGDVTEDTSKEITTKISYLNERFSHLNSYFGGLTPNQQRDLLLPYMGEELKQLNKFKNNFKDKINKKSKWDSNDTVMYTYYLLYQDTIAFLYTTFKSASRDRIVSILNIIKHALFLYKPIMLAYVLDKPFKHEILVRRIAELRAFLNPRDIFPITPKIYEVYKEISSVAPVYDTLVSKE